MQPQLMAPFTFAVYHSINIPVTRMPIPSNMTIAVPKISTVFDSE